MLIKTIHLSLKSVIYYLINVTTFFFAHTEPNPQRGRRRSEEGNGGPEIDDFHCIPYFQFLPCSPIFNSRDNPQFVVMGVVGLRGSLNLQVIRDGAIMAILSM